MTEQRTALAWGDTLRVGDRTLAVEPALWVGGVVAVPDIATCGATKLWMAVDWADATYLTGDQPGNFAHRECTPFLPPPAALSPEREARLAEAWAALLTLPDALSTQGNIHNSIEIHLSGATSIYIFSSLVGVRPDKWTPITASVNAECEQDMALLGRAQNIGTVLTAWLAAVQQGVQHG